MSATGVSPKPCVTFHRALVQRPGMTQVPGAAASSGVGVEIFVEEDELLPELILRVMVVISMTGPPASCRVGLEQRNKSSRNLFGNILHQKRHS